MNNKFNKLKNIKFWNFVSKRNYFDGKRFSKKLDFPISSCSSLSKIKINEPYYIKKLKGEGSTKENRNSNLHKILVRRYNNINNTNNAENLPTQTVIATQVVHSDTMIPPKVDNHHDTSLKTIIMALSGNAIITVAKFASFFISGSSAMLAEAIHT